MSTSISPKAVSKNKSVIPESTKFERKKESAAVYSDAMVNRRQTMREVTYSDSKGSIELFESDGWETAPGQTVHMPPIRGRV